MIRWLLTRDLPEFNPGLFLNPREEEEGRRFRHPGRRRQWLLGRAAAKVLLQRNARESGAPSVPPSRLWVHRTDEGWPEPLGPEGRPLPVSLTISHTGDLAFCALCPDGEGSLGADMERVEARVDAFLEDYYTPLEQTRLRALPPLARNQMATVLWCIKEAVLKALRTGLALHPTLIEVRELELLPPQAWKRAEVLLVDGTRPDVYWCLIDKGQVAIAVARIPRFPIEPRC
jgi:phosphopantetheinyl transferase